MDEDPVPQSPDAREELVPLDEAYVTVRQLDSGVNGGVFLCLRRNTDIQLPSADIQQRICAYKIMTNEPGSNNTNEINKLKSMKGEHPSIIPLLEFGSMRSSWLAEPWMTMPYYPSGSLQNLINKMDEQLPNAFAWHTLVELGRAFVWLHTDAQLAHNDLHRSNILVDFSCPCDFSPYPSLILADFGYAMSRHEVDSDGWEKSMAKDFLSMAKAAKVTSGVLAKSGERVMKELYGADDEFTHWVGRLEEATSSKLTDEDIQEKLIPLAIEKRSHPRYQDTVWERFAEIVDSDQKQLILDTEKAVKAISRNDRAVSSTASTSMEY